MCSVSHAQMQNSWIFDLCGFYTTASLTYAHSSVTPMRLTLLLRCCLRLLVSYSASAPQLSLFLLTRDIRARVLDLVADVRPLSRGVSDRVQRRVPRVLLRFIGGEETEVLPPHVSGELRYP